jgi:hypothetical protein
LAFKDHLDPRAIKGILDQLGLLGRLVQLALREHKGYRVPLGCLEHLAHKAIPGFKGTQDSLGCKDMLVCKVHKVHLDFKAQPETVHKAHAVRVAVRAQGGTSALKVDVKNVDARGFYLLPNNNAVRKK